MTGLLDELLTKEDETSPEPNKLGFIGEQLLTIAKEHYVSNPTDIAYQFSRKIAKELIESKYSISNELVKEGLAIGVYKGLEKLMQKIVKR